MSIDPRAEVNTSGKPFVRLDRSSGGGVAEIVFDRPEKLNAWAWGPTNELCAIADELRFDSSVRAVVMRGEGRAFCAGEDLKPERHDVRERHAGRSPAEQVRNSYERARYCFERWQVVSDLPQPVVVAIHGYCLGAGVELALLGDIRVAASDAVFALAQATIGVPVVGGADMRLAVECGAGAAKLLALTGRRFSAEEAQRIGFVQQVVDPDELLTTARALAAEIANNAPIAVQSIKRSINAWVRRGFHEAALFEAMSSSVAFVSDDLYEGFAAAAAKRQPDFEGK
ncbi:MAG TPA: enoyl-CoA hydratase/isomerase family protein [Acidimicrobiia bacterium]|nr:enoyl-CoA hydratase/isomerase family protein [Acidimicrobiia bacterium]